MGGNRIHFVRTRGGNRKFRALRLEAGNFAWASEGSARKTRILDVVYNASNNELVRTKTLVKNAIVVVDATPFRQYYEGHYLLPLARRKEAKAGEENEALTKKRSKKAMKKYLLRQKIAKIDPALEEQFAAGRLLGEFSFPTRQQTQILRMMITISDSQHNFLRARFELRSKPVKMIMLVIVTLTPQPNFPSKTFFLIEF